MKYVLTRNSNPVLLFQSSRIPTQEDIENYIRQEYSNDFTLVSYNCIKGWTYRFNKSGMEHLFNITKVPYKNL